MIPDSATAPREFLLHLYRTAVRWAQPQDRLEAFLPAPPKGRTLVLGAGKAGGGMAQALERLWPAQAPLSGLVVTPYGHIPPRPPDLAQRIEVVEAAHPVPDGASQAAAQRMLALARGLTADDLVICLMSGGGSSLLSLPAEGLTLEAKQHVHRALLRSGASIGEMNCVRKHLSRIKGGRLAAACAPAPLVTLLISDVPGDDPSVIASGPTVPDPTTCAEALDILRRYAVDLPAPVRERLASGALETPKPDEALFGGHSVHLVATPQQSLEAAAREARAAGLAAHILSDEVEGESREVAKVHAALARAAARGRGPFTAPCVILSGGETTVTLAHAAQPSGRGGRASEFCLSLALALRAQPGVWALAADTDGIDGTGDNAGAVVTPDTLARARQLGLPVQDHLDGHDAYPVFEALGDLVVTGPTFTNVNDFRALLIL